MQQDFSTPVFMQDAFYCPYTNCSVYAAQTWSVQVLGRTDRRPGYGVTFQVDDLQVSRCFHCKQDAIWVNGKLIFPQNIAAPLPNVNIPANVRDDYLEAASISDQSPCGAAALLRLAIQKLCIHLGQSGKNINDDIAALVKAGLPVQIQKALDIVRVVGNNAVHPGVIDLRDKPATVYALYNLINQIVQDRITQPNAINALYNTLPEKDREAINKRDTPKS